MDVELIVCKRVSTNTIASYSIGSPCIGGFVLYVLIRVSLSLSIAGVTCESSPAVSAKSISTESQYEPLVSLIVLLVLLVELKLGNTIRSSYPKMQSAILYCD